MNKPFLWSPAVLGVCSLMGMFGMKNGNFSVPSIHIVSVPFPEELIRKGIEGGLVIDLTGLDLVRVRPHLASQRGIPGLEFNQYV